MCKASIDEPDARDVRQGERITIGVNELGMGVVTLDQGLRGAETGCVTCVHTGAQIRLDSVTPAVQEFLGVDRVTLVMIETPGSHSWVIHDLVAVVGQRDLGQLPLVAFFGCHGVVTKAVRRGVMTAKQVIGQAAEVVPVTDEEPLEMLRRIANEAAARTPKPLAAAPSRPRETART